jgi:acetyl-CoA carboxylase carboxyl transferase subunit beta
VGNNVPDNLWEKCGKCEQMIFRKELLANLYVCPHCDNHMKIGVEDRLKSLFDNEEFIRIRYNIGTSDPLKFKDVKKYVDRLKASQEATGEKDAAVVGHGSIGGHQTVAVLFSFDFMGGSMGAAVGEAFIAGAEMAVSKGCSFLAIPCSGGARMQEGIFSLMQMPRTVVAVNKVKEMNLPYIVVLTNPTTGGVSASFAMLGDIHLAEPEALVAFTGPRVIEGTIRERLPVGFQLSEYLLDHGMVDMVVHRKDLKDTIAKILGILTHKTSSFRK